MDAVFASAPSKMACTGAGFRDARSSSKPEGMTSAMRTAPRLSRGSIWDSASSRLVTSKRPDDTNAETSARLCALWSRSSTATAMSRTSKLMM